MHMSLSSSLSFSIGGDLPVHRLGYGTMRLVGDGAWGEPPSRADAHAILRRAVELGVTLLDTADAYGPQIAEELISEALYPYPADLVIATKGGLARTGPAKSKPVGLPQYLKQSVELSLRRLRVERIDLYQLHRIDPQVPVAETLGALRELQDAGKIRHVGLSEVTIAQIEEAAKTTPIVSVQNKYSLTERKSEAVLDYCTERSIAFLPWYPLAAGKLVRAANDDPGANHPFADLAKQHGVTVSQLSLAWLLHRSRAICPIPGTGSMAHLEENMAAASTLLSGECWDELDLIMDTQAS